MKAYQIIFQRILFIFILQIYDLYILNWVSDYGRCVNCNNFETWVKWCSVRNVGVICFSLNILALLLGWHQGSSHWSQYSSFYNCSTLVTFSCDKGIDWPITLSLFLWIFSKKRKIEVGVSCLYRLTFKI